MAGSLGQPEHQPVTISGLFQFCMGGYKEERETRAFPRCHFKHCILPLRSSDPFHQHGSQDSLCFPGGGLHPRPSEICPWTLKAFIPGNFYVSTPSLPQGGLQLVISVNAKAQLCLQQDKVHSAIYTPELLTYLLVFFTCLPC